MKPLIIDVGSYSIRFGFAGEYMPRFDVPLLVGRVREDLDFTQRKNIFKDLNINPKQEYFFGHEAVYLRTS